MLTVGSIRKLEMAPRPDHFPRRYLSPCFSSHPLPPCWRQYDLGCHLQRSDRYLILPRGSNHHQEVQGDLHLVHFHDRDDDCFCGSRTYWQAGSLRLADHRICHHLAIGEHRRLPLLAAAGAQPGIDAIHVLMFF